MVAQTTMQPPESGLFSGPDEKKRERVSSAYKLYCSQRTISRQQLKYLTIIVTLVDVIVHVCLLVGWFVRRTVGLS